MFFDGEIILTWLLNEVIINTYIYSSMDTRKFKTSNLEIKIYAYKKS